MKLQIIIVKKKKRRQRESYYITTSYNANKIYTKKTKMKIKAQIIEVKERQEKRREKCRRQG